MAKDKLTDYSATNASNTDVGGVNINEGMLPSDVNNAIREVMTHLKDFAEGTEAVNSLAVDNININGNTISSTDTNGNINITPNGSGAVAFTTNATFGDNDKAIFGDAVGGDLQIYHDGSNSKIQETGTGDLFIDSSSALTLRQYSTNSVTAKFVGGGASELYYSNSKKLETTATGADITGTVTADGLTVDGNVSINGTNAGQLTLDATGQYTQMLFEQNSVANSGGDLIYDHTGNQFQLRSLGAGSISFKTGTSAGNTLNRAVIANNGDVSLYADDGTTQALFFDASTQRLGLGTTAPDQKLHIQDTSASIRQKFLTGTTNQVSIDFGDTDSGTVGRIEYDHFTDAMAFRTNAAERLRITSAGNVGIGTVSPERQLHVEGAGLIKNTSGEALFKLQAANNSNSILELADTDDGNVGRIQYEHDNNAMLLYTNDSEKLRITSAGLLGLGTASPTQEIHGYSGGGDFSLKLESASATGTAYTYYKNADREYATGIRGSAGDSFQIIDVTADTTRLTVDTSGNTTFSGTVFAPNVTLYPNSSAPNADAAIYRPQDGTLGFVSNGSERARFKSDGTYVIGASSDDNMWRGTGSNEGFRFNNNYAASQISANNNIYMSKASGYSDATYISFWINGTQLGNINTNGSTISYNTSSDRRLKSNIEDAASASDKIDAIRVRQFDWSVDDSHQDYGLIAQELQPIEPMAVTGDADSDEMMSVDYSKLVPMLIKEIQELRGRVAALEAS